VPGTENHLPADLLRAVAQRRGHVALVVGAGCSLEPPTALQLGSHYATDAHRQLLAEGVLAEDECTNPEDLSVLASTVHDKCGTQRPLVDRLPKQRFRLARPNRGHLLAAALLREGAVAAVLTLNFDLALSAALAELSAVEVDIVAGPETLNEFGRTALVYLHRNVDEVDAERWILRKEALAREWQGQWEEVVVRRVVATPHIVFAGLGAPAEVLTTTVALIRDAIGCAHSVHLVGPDPDTEFATALRVPETDKILLGWCDFMILLAKRLETELAHELEQEGRTLCDDHGWEDEIEHIQSLCDRFMSQGLVDSGKARSQWLLRPESYTVHSIGQELVADLLLAIGIIERELGAEAIFREDGIVTLCYPNGARVDIMPASGRGSRSWSVIESRARERAKSAGPLAPRFVLIAGVTGEAQGADISPPDDIVGSLDRDNIAATNEMECISVHAIRDDVTTIGRIF
jgi:hypothetical protein